MGQEILTDKQKYFLQKAQENFPKIYYKTITLPEKTNLETGDSFVLDLGNHYVGKFSFKMDNVNVFIDAPTKLIVKFCEDMREVEDDFSNYKGRMSYTWLQEEAVFIDYPKTVNMERRFSCRYIKITVEKTKYPIKLYDFTFTASTSANEEILKPATTSTPILQKIDSVATNTLKECMQTFFEDGPKRDRRLWIGDLRLEALTNYYTFNNLELVKRCLYLFAAGKTNSLGFVSSYIYETPYFVSGIANIIDYALLYVVTVCDYFNHTNDVETVNDLLTICKNQLDCFEKILDNNLIVTKQEGWAFFIDWCPGLSGYIALQGVYLYTLEKFIKLLKSINDKDYKKYEELLAKVRQASKKLFNEEKGVFVGEIDGYQLSVHSQVWMILGGVIDGEKAQNLLISILKNKDAKQPFTPYMWHYVTEAMFKLELKEEATNVIKEFWGGMIERGADTFYEVYVPSDSEFSPYGDRMNNSLCHAWSCTPSYFIRKYNL